LYLAVVSLFCHGEILPGLAFPVKIYVFLVSYPVEPPWMDPGKDCRDNCRLPRFNPTFFSSFNTYLNLKSMGYEYILIKFEKASAMRKKIPF
jgi:hypothetical protein